MINLIPLKNKDKWNNYVKEFSSFDTYYTVEYIEPFTEIEDSNIFLLTFQKDNFKLCYPILIKDISKDTKFNNILQANKFYDVETPYGYGGPIIENFANDYMKMFYNELYQWANSHNIVSHFFRFHPLIENHKFCENFSEIKTFKQTVYIDLKDEDTIYKNMNDKCRNMVKKAQKNNFYVEIDNSKKSQETFINLYRDVMKKKKANDFYLFNKHFFIKLFTTLDRNCNLFTVKSNDMIIASAIILEENFNLHYHLAASDYNFVHLGINNLLLYEVAKYGSRKRYKYLHLGGGVDAKDGLFAFKKSFNKNGLKNFYIGRNIFNIDKYNYLMKLRQSYDKTFNINNNRMIGYRAVGTR